MVGRDEQVACRSSSSEARMATFCVDSGNSYINRNLKGQHGSFLKVLHTVFCFLKIIGVGVLKMSWTELNVIKGYWMCCRNAVVRHPTLYN